MMAGNSARKPMRLPRLRSSSVGRTGYQGEEEGLVETYLGDFRFIRLVDHEAEEREERDGDVRA